jgi:glycosyltransferase involved in cell wall biosynthesis
MRLALFVPAPWDTVSGGYVYDRRIVAGLRAIGHRVDVVALDGRYPVPGARARANAKALLVRCDPAARPLIDGLALPAFEDLAAELAQRGAVALIHHPTALETGLDAEARPELRRIECALLPRLARVIATSEATATQLAQEFGVPPEQVFVVEPGTDDAERSSGSGQRGCHIIAVGALVQRKGHDVLLRALARLFDLDWRLMVIGSSAREPAYAQSLAVLAAELGIGARVCFAGETSQEALEVAWRRADMFALATHWEGFGMAVAEAIKRGLPVAVTAGGAAAQLVTAELGITAPPGDDGVLSKAMRRIIFDTALREEMAEAAWRAGQGLPDWSAQAQRFAASLE